jgi:hypothetical protein
LRPVGTVPCDEQLAGAPNRDFSVADVLKHGVVTENSCGQFAPEPIRGQLTYLVRNAPGLELFKN